MNAVVRRVALVLAALLAVPVQAADYRAPTGFNGRTWGQPLNAFKGLKLWHAQEAIQSLGKITDPGFSCTPFFRPTTIPTEPPQLSYTCQANIQSEGDGSFAVAEYYFNQDRNPWFQQQIQVVTISYLFCARWFGDYAPKDIKKRLTLCGVRINFKSETKEQLLAKRDDRYDSNFDRIRRQLIAEYGVPPGFEQSGRITIESENERLTTPTRDLPEYIQYRWCGVKESA